MSNYFRITAYLEARDISIIIDSNEMFEKLWQFSSYLIQKGFKIIEVGNSDKFQDVNIEPIDFDKDHITMRACAKGKPQYIDHTIDGEIFKAIKVGEKIYIPNAN